jgi:hypothetical protein
MRSSVYGSAYGPQNFATLSSLSSVVKNSNFEFDVYNTKAAAKINKYMYTKTRIIYRTFPKHSKNKGALPFMFHNIELMTIS